jgi:hypothetical protein
MVQSLTKELTMKVVRVAVTTVAILAVATLSWAQRPDFSGTWTLDADASGMAAGGPGRGGGGRGGGRGGMMGLGQTASVKQTADTLTVERTVMDNKLVSTYKLDGSESRNTMMGRGGNQTEAVSVAKWDGQTLVLTTKLDMGGQTVESTQRWSLAGNVLTIETTGARGTQKMVYKKS